MVVGWPGIPAKPKAVACWKENTATRKAAIPTHFMTSTFAVEKSTLIFKLR